MISHHDAPALFPRRILLAVSGLSPQILTETLYALGVASSATSEPFAPTEIHLVTTLEGAQRARASLLHADGGQYAALLADYPVLGLPTFTDDHIHVITDASGAPLNDIRTPAENAAAADAITALVAEFTSDERAALHVSVAGGRKTMGFYLGYAFSLFARPQDRLSHVLVSSPFEGHPDFFFPPRIPRRLSARDGSHVDTADACVTLAEIPVVRLRHGLPLALQQGRASYVQSVHAVQQSLALPHLAIDLVAQRVHCAQQEVRLPPISLAWLAWWAQAALAQQPLMHWREANVPDFLALYKRLVGRDAAAMEHAQARLAHGMQKEFFDENNSKLQRALRDQLDLSATPYLLVTEGKRPHTRRGLALPTHAIRLKLD